MDQEEAKDESPVEETPAEQTKVYQNRLPELTTQPSPDQNLPIQPGTPDVPRLPPPIIKVNTKRTNQNTVDQRKQKVDPLRTQPERTAFDPNLAEPNKRIPPSRTHTSSASDGKSSIWVTMMTDQPGFLFPVAKTTSMPVRRRITEESSLSASPKVTAPLPLFIFSSFLCSRIDFRAYKLLTSQWVFLIQSRGKASKEPTSGGDLPPLGGDVFPLPAVDMEVTDVYYEDVVNSTLFEQVPSTMTPPAQGKRCYLSYGFFCC